MSVRANHQAPDETLRLAYRSQSIGRYRHRFNLVVDEELFGRLRAIAVCEELGMSTVARELLLDGLAARDLKR